MNRDLSSGLYTASQQIEFSSQQEYVQTLSHLSVTKQLPTFKQFCHLTLIYQAFNLVRKVL